MNKVRDVFSRVGQLKIVTYLGRNLPKVDKRSILLVACIAMIAALAISIRMLPIKWGFNLSEFDPYYQYDVTQHIVENGLFSWTNWHMDDKWFPQGKDVAGGSFPGFPMTVIFPENVLQKEQGFIVLSVLDKPTYLLHFFVKLGQFFLLLCKSLLIICI
jgi:hypothetical protein